MSCNFHQPNDGWDVAPIASTCTDLWKDDTNDRYVRGLVNLGVLTGQRRPLHVSANKPCEGHWGKEQSPCCCCCLEPFYHHLLVRLRKARHQTCTAGVSSLGEKRRGDSGAPSQETPHRRPPWWHRAWQCVANTVLVPQTHSQEIQKKYLNHFISPICCFLCVSMIVSKSVYLRKF